MYLNARIHIADVMDQIVVQATVLHWDHTNSLVAEPYYFNAQVQGDGQDDPREWLKDALIGLLEAL